MVIKAEKLLIPVPKTLAVPLKLTCENLSASTQALSLTQKIPVRVSMSKVAFTALSSTNL